MQNFDRPPVPGSEAGPDHQARIEEERVLAQAELIRGGAAYENGAFKVTPEQRQEAEREMRDELFRSSPDYRHLHAREEQMTDLLQELFTRYRNGTEVFKGTGSESFLDVLNLREKRFEELLSAMDLPYPETREAGEALYRRVQQQIGRLRETMNLMTENPSLRTGAEVDVRRSSGEMESGWKIEAIRSNGTARVIQEEKRLTKHAVPLGELAAWNGKH